MSHENLVHVGLDIGSTTVKVMVLDPNNQVLFCRYQRHFSEVRSAVAQIMNAALETLPGKEWTLAASGSGAISLAPELGISFVQEVIASSRSICLHIPDVDVAIELGGEDAKITFFSGGVDQRMNETCAGGTGAFIDQMAAFLNTDAPGLDLLAKKHSTIYPIASRCGVFAKTDVLPLLNEGCAKEDIAASIFQAVVEQTVSGLACGREIKGKVVFLGGPLAFLESLRERFAQVLHLDAEHALFPQYAEYFVAMGAALFAHEQLGGQSGRIWAADELHTVFSGLAHNPANREMWRLPPLFTDAAEKSAFLERHAQEKAVRAPLEEYHGAAFLGIDIGSTTIKATLIDTQGRLLFSHYNASQGEPLEAAVKILKEIYAKKMTDCTIRSCAVTGYGSALISAALGADIDEVETIAHCKAAQFFLPDVSFVLDIGGQDIKCLSIKDGIIDRIQLNEACSAGCGSFIATFARSLEMPLPDFVAAALDAKHPVDLGTRCTVFMNSKVKQAQKEGVPVGDVAAGLSYSVIKNALYKVIRIAAPEELGTRVIAQGGSFLNDALLRSLELCLGRNVLRPDIAGLMGAFGAALIARERCTEKASELISAEKLKTFRVDSSVTRCQRCTNHCLLTISRFSNGHRFISGNRCERGAGMESKGAQLPNLVAYKTSRLFDPYIPLDVDKATRGTVGIPRVLNMYENYPLWFTLFHELGFRVELSSPSSKKMYSLGISTIPSQSVCYPAKLVHGHIMELASRKPDWIFYPCIPFELREFAAQDNQYNCPVVGGYPELIINNIDVLHINGVRLVAPFLPLQQDALVKRLQNLEIFADISADDLRAAVTKGFEEMEHYKQDVRLAGEQALQEIKAAQQFAVILAGHPYHIDPEIHHGIPDLITAAGLAVLTEDSIAHLAPEPHNMRVVDQWTYHARLYRAATFAAQSPHMALIQLVSFGCGLDAVTTDQVEEILRANGSLYTQIKIDEGTNLGPARIRIRSLLATMRERQGTHIRAVAEGIYQGSPPFTQEMRATHTILIPQMSPIHFQFLETVLDACGYKGAVLPTIEKGALEEGLRHVNNDACFPAIAIVGQLLHALKTKNWDKDKVALMISQTGGGCRATNYIGFLRKALASCGMDHIPIISMNVKGFDNNPGFKINWAMMKRLLLTGFYGDMLMRLTHRIRPYELEPGSTQRLQDNWVPRCTENVRNGSLWQFRRTVTAMVKSFDELPINEHLVKPRVGLVGEILLKFHPDANNRAVEVVEAEGGEAVVPDLMDFMLYTLYDDIYRHKELNGDLKACLTSLASLVVLDLFRKPLVRVLRKSKRFNAPIPLKGLLYKVRGLVSPGHQTGEGWLLTAEMVELIESGVPNILCMQPFGCLPNHITGKGVIKELKTRYPAANIAAVDYDPGTSETNQINRIKLMMSVARQQVDNQALLETM